MAHIHFNKVTNIIYDPGSYLAVVRIGTSIYEYWELLKNVLEKQFLSIEFDTAQNNYFIFKFTDPADEAFFLIWSNDGIEI
jgi:hypothetical protein